MIALVYTIIFLVITFIVILIIEILGSISKYPKAIIDKSNTPEEAMDLIISDLNKTKRQIFIVTGNGNPKFYGDKKIYDAFIKSSEKVFIEIISGNLKNDMENPLRLLSRDCQNIHLHIIKESNYLRPHFRIIDNHDVFVERFHEIDSDKRVYCYFYNDRFLARKYRKKFFELYERAETIN